jgi:hypothetical protein
MPCSVGWEGIYEIYSGTFECFNLGWSRQVDFFKWCWLIFLSPLPEKDFLPGMSSTFLRDLGSAIAGKKILRGICK